MLFLYGSALFDVGCISLALGRACRGFQSASLALWLVSLLGQNLVFSPGWDAPERMREPSLGGRVPGVVRLGALPLGSRPERRLSGVLSGI